MVREEKTPLSLLLLDLHAAARRKRKAKKRENLESRRWAREEREIFRKSSTMAGD